MGFFDRAGSLREQKVPPPGKFRVIVLRLQDSGCCDGILFLAGRIGKNEDYLDFDTEEAAAMFASQEAAKFSGRCALQVWGQKSRSLQEFKGTASPQDLISR